MNLPELQKRGYPEAQTIGSLGGPATLGLLIPPSIILIVYGVSAELSISKLFMAGVLPGLMLAVLFRGIENFKMFDLVVQLTGGGPGNTTEVTSINLKREAFAKWRTGYSSAYAIILFVPVFGLASIYVKALNKVKNR